VGRQALGEMDMGGRSGALAAETGFQIIIRTGNSQCNQSLGNFVEIASEQ
jgi:hypothetical protein